MKKLLFIFVFALCGYAHASCDLVLNQPQYGFVTIPSTSLQLSIHQTNCPSQTVSQVVIAGTGGAHPTVTFTVPSTTGFSVGKKVVTSGFTTYPFDRLYNGSTFTITATTGTTITGVYDNYPYGDGTAAVGGTITQNTLLNVSASSGTLSCTSNCIPSVNFITDSTAGTLSTAQPASPYPGGGYTLQSTHSMTVTFTSVDDGAKTATYTILQGPNSTMVRTSTKYTQVYKNQLTQIFATVFGNNNSQVTWGVTGTGCGISGPSNKNNVLISGSTNGHCTVTATSVADGSKTDTTDVYVASTNVPSWASSPPDKIPPVPCQVDSAKTVYEVGPGQTYTSIVAVPWQTLTVPWEVRIHYATYAEYTQIVSIGAGQANYICGVEDGSGHYPTITGVNAHGPSWMPLAGLAGTGLFVLFPNSTGCSGAGADSTLSCGPTNLTIEGFNMTGANGANTYTKPDGVTVASWGDGSSCVSMRTGANISVEAINCNNTSQAFSTYANQNGGLASLSQNFHLARSYLANNGIAHDSTNHPLYMQSIYANIIDRVYVDNPVSLDDGSCMKLRGQGNVIINSYCASSDFDRSMDFVESQDDPGWISFAAGTTDGGLVNGGPYNTSAVNYSLAFNAAMQNSMYRDVILGNIIRGGGFHYLMDHDDNIGNIGMNSRIGKLTSAYNTFTNIGSGYGTFNQYNLNYFLNPQFDLQNNINWMTSNYGINDEAMFIGRFQTNVSNAAVQTITAPLWGGYYNDGSNSGWVGFAQANNYYMVRPLDLHQSTATSYAADFITSLTTPYNATTFSATGTAVGVASSLTGLAAQYQIPYDAVVVPGVYNLRTSVSDAGAVMATGVPTPVSIAVTPNPLSTLVSLSGTLTCTTTLSDSSTRACISPSCTSTNTASMTITGVNWTATATPGSGNLNCGAESLTAPTDPFTVNALPPQVTKINGNIKFSGHLSLSR